MDGEVHRRLEYPNELTSKDYKGSEGCEMKTSS